MNLGIMTTDTPAWFHELQYQTFADFGVTFRVFAFLGDRIENTLRSYPPMPFKGTALDEAFPLVYALMNPAPEFP